MRASREFPAPPDRGRLASRRRAIRGVTLIELLCVMVIIAILMSLLLPAVTRAYRRAKAMSEEIEEDGVAELLLNSTRAYCASVPKFRFDSKSDFADKCNLAPKCRDWVHTGTTDFVPFGYQDPTNTVVLAFHYGKKHALTRSFSITELSVRPEPR